MNNRRLRCCVVFLVTSVLLAGIAKPQQSHDKDDAFAKCLTKKNAVMYGSFLCSHCDEQRKLFGESFKYIHYVECSHTASSQDASACKREEIRYTPTWILDDGERLVGIQTLKLLSEKTACPLP